MQGGRHAGFSAPTKIDREEWGLTWNVGLEAGGWLVGKEITISIDAAADQGRREGGLGRCLIRDPAPPARRRARTGHARPPGPRPGVSSS